MSNNYTKDFCISKDDEIIYVHLKYDIATKDEVDHYAKFNIRLSIEYIIIENQDGFYIQNEISDCKWSMQGDEHSSSVSCNIFIDDNYQSLGLGTLMLYEMLLCAKKIAPDSKLFGTLSSNQDTAENGKRRDKLYRRVGFEITPDKTMFSIDKISNLKLDGCSLDVKEMNISILFARKTSESTFNLDRCRKENKDYWHTINMIRKNNNLLSIILIISFLVNILLLYI